MSQSDVFGGVYVVNLDRRTDRLKEFTEQMDSVGLPFQRFSAIETKPGALGCAMSHLKIVKDARRLGLKNVLIFEDDFNFKNPEIFWSRINEFFAKNIEFDVLMLAYAIQKSEPYSEGLLKVLEAQTTSAYVVNERFYDKLIAVNEEAVSLFSSTGQHWKYAADQAWKKLQPNACWLAVEPRLGYQRASVTDTGMTPGYSDYGV
jgi:GR25 family glycosyltransferase involved in LPS biosynthesis